VRTLGRAFTPPPTSAACVARPRGRRLLRIDAHARPSRRPGAPQQPGRGRGPVARRDRRPAGAAREPGDVTAALSAPPSLPSRLGRRRPAAVVARRGRGAPARLSSVATVPLGLPAPPSCSSSTPGRCAGGRELPALASFAARSARAAVGDYAR
jgi:hypothetical protein